MLDICEPLFSEECLVGDAITNMETHSGALYIIDTVTDVEGVPYGIFELNRCSCGSSQRVRVERHGEGDGMNL